MLDGEVCNNSYRLFNYCYKALYLKYLRGSSLLFCSNLWDISRNGGSLHTGGILNVSKRSRDIQGVLWTSYTFSVYVQCTYFRDLHRPSGKSLKSVCFHTAYSPVHLSAITGGWKIALGTKLVFIKITDQKIVKHLLIFGCNADQQIVGVLNIEELNIEGPFHEQPKMKYFKS